MVVQPAGTVSSPASGVLLSGTVPPLADAYYPREQSGPDLASSVRAGETVVLIHGEETELAPAAQGGTGKTQLAVEFTHAMWNTRAVEILIWVNAASRESVITGFAQAANTVDASQPDEGAETAAARFVSWLANTRRPWALVIDDLAELSDLDELWPAGASGRVLITTRLPADAFEDPAFDDRKLRIVPVPGLNRREALDYVTSRLTDHPDQRKTWLEDFEGVAPTAVEEIVRVASPVIFMRRTATQDYTMNGQDYREGDKVVLFYYSGNRDEAVFTDPERFDITRSPNPHVGFGAPGPHFCLGAHLARRELTVMLRELLTRVPGITAGEPDRLLSSFINGIKRLPCEFTSAGRPASFS